MNICFNETCLNIKLTPVHLAVSLPLTATPLTSPASKLFVSNMMKSDKPYWDDVSSRPCFMCLKSNWLHKVGNFRQWYSLGSFKIYGIYFLYFCNHVAVVSFLILHFPLSGLHLSILLVFFVFVSHYTLSHSSVQNRIKCHFWLIKPIKCSKFLIYQTITLMQQFTL